MSKDTTYINNKAKSKFTGTIYFVYFLSPHTRITGILPITSLTTKENQETNIGPCQLTETYGFYRQKESVYSFLEKFSVINYCFVVLQCGRLTG